MYVLFKIPWGYKYHRPFWTWPWNGTIASSPVPIDFKIVFYCLRACVNISHKFDGPLRLKNKYMLPTPYVYFLYAFYPCTNANLRNTFSNMLDLAAAQTKRATFLQWNMKMTTIKRVAICLYWICKKCNGSAA